jgi:hypothetical protein
VITLLLRNHDALMAVWDALTQYVQNTEDIEDDDDFTDEQRAQLDEARKLQAAIDLLFIKQAG